MLNSELLLKMKDPIRILLWDRASGKTTECIKFLRENPEAIVTINALAARSTYPEDLRNRVISVNNMRGRNLVPIAIDNADLFTEDQLRFIFRIFDVKLMTLSPRGIIDFLMMKHGFEKKENLQYRELVGSRLNDGDLIS